MTTFLKKSLTLAGLIGFAAAGPAAWADQNLNCGAYAAKAVEQEKQNQMLGCGFKGLDYGAGWSLDFNAHFDWCGRSDVKMEHLTAHDRIREGAIQTCHQQKQAAQGQQNQINPAIIQVQPQVDQATGQEAKTMDVLCGRYAISAREQNQENRTFNCGFAGGRWSDDVNGHRAWCMTAGIGAADGETRVRNAMLNDCKGGGKCVKGSNCGPYLCNVATGACFTSCSTTMAHCAADYVCDEGQCRHRSNYQ